MRTNISTRKLNDDQNETIKSCDLTLVKINLLR